MSKKLIFKSAADFLNTLQEGTDLYNPLISRYLFSYNEEGAIASYFVAPRDARNLARESFISGEYWGASLGMGGSIYEDGDEEYLAESLYNEKGWMRCTDVKF